MQRSVLFRNLGWQTFYQFISNLMGFVFTIVLARSVSVFYFGVYSYIISVLYIAGLFLELGIPNYFLRKWSTDKAKIVEEARLFLGSRILLSVPVSLVLLAYVFFIDRFVSFEFVLFYFYFLLEGPLQVQRIFFSAKNDFHISAVVDLVDRLLATGGGTIALLLGAPLKLVLIIFITSRLVAIAVSLRFSKLRLVPIFSLQHGLNVIRAASPLFLLAVFSILYFRVDMIIVRYLLGVTAVGLYSSAYRLLEAAVILPNLVLSVFVPELTNLFAAKQTEAVRYVAKRLFFLLSIPSLLFAIVTTLYSHEILSFLYRGQYVEAAGVLAVLGWTAFFLFMNIPVAHLLFASHSERYQTKILLGITAVNIFANILLIPRFGILGAAYATLACEIISLTLLFRRIHFPLKDLLPVTKSLLVAGIVFVMGSLLDIPWIIEGAFLGLAYILGLMVLFPREMRRYVWKTRNG